MVAPNERLVRIYASAKVDHLSAPEHPLHPICGQKRHNGEPWIRDVGIEPYPGTHLCARCAALAGVPA